MMHMDISVGYYFLLEDGGRGSPWGETWTTMTCCEGLSGVKKGCKGACIANRRIQAESFGPNDSGSAVGHHRLPRTMKG